MFTSDVLNNKCFKQMKIARLLKNVTLWAISRREISPLVVILKKKIDQPLWRTTRRNYKHYTLNRVYIIQIPSASPFFMGIWAIWRYTDKLVGKISAQPHTIVKQTCFPYGNVLFLSLFSLSKNWMHNVGLCGNFTNLYVIWNMLTSADLHETILTPVICHKYVRYHDGVTLYFSVNLPSVAPKKTRNGYFSYMSADFRFLK